MKGGEGGKVGGTSIIYLKAARKGARRFPRGGRHQKKLHQLDLADNNGVLIVEIREKKVGFGRRVY